MDQSDEQIRIQLFRAIMDRSSECFLFIDPNNEIRYWSRAAETLFGLSAEVFPAHDSVQRCALLTIGELDCLRSDGSKAISGLMIIDGPSQSKIGLTRDIERVEVDGEHWFIVRLKSPPLSKNSESELYLQARTDHLSGLLNRRGFQISLEENLHRQLALAIIDIDFFKNINDTHGHESGDRAIQWLADRLRNEFPDAVCIGRLGGDEFGIVLESSDRDVIGNRFQVFCRDIGANQDCSQAGGMTISIGVAIADSPGVPARELLSQADRAMYQSKDRGRNSSTTVEVASHF